MAIRSRDFVGIAEGIKSHELSTKGKIEQLKEYISELSDRKRSLNETISYLEAAIAAAYEVTDSDGYPDPDYGLIASLESEKGSAENELSHVEQDLDDTGDELEQSESELENLLEEKAQALFEIQERARTTAQNIAIAGGMYGAYAGVGGTLQNSMQTSLSVLSQAAGILGGTVAGNGVARGGNTTAEAGNFASTGGDSFQGDLSISPLASFVGDETNTKVADVSAFQSASQFISGQTDSLTPGTLPNFHSGKITINAQKPQNFASNQVPDDFTVASFANDEIGDEADNSKAYVSEQQSSVVVSQLSSSFSRNSTGYFENTSTDINTVDDGFFRKKEDKKEIQESAHVTKSERRDLQRKRAWAKQYEVDISKNNGGQNNATSSSESGVTSRGQLEKQLFKETGMEIDDSIIGLLLGEVAGKASPVFTNQTISDGQDSDAPSYLERGRAQDKPYEIEDKFNILHKLSKKSDESFGMLKNQILVGKIDKCVAEKGWKPKSKLYSLEEDLKAVNPNFYKKSGNDTAEKEEWTRKWTRNCQRCVIAFEARLRGANVQATERLPDEVDMLPRMDHPKGWLSVFENPKPVNCLGSSGIDIKQNVLKEMRKNGDGTRAIIRIQRCHTIDVADNKNNKDNKGNNVFAVEEINGKTVVCDIDTREEVDLSSSFPDNDFSEGIEIGCYRSIFKSKVFETRLLSKKDGKKICIAKNNGGHVFSAIQQNGKTVFCDAQTGKVIDEPEKYFRLAKREQTYVVRIDNLGFTERAKDCCQSVDE